MTLIRRTATPEVPTQSADRRSPVRDVPGLIESLSDPTADVRRRAALDLAGAAEAIPALLGRVGPEPDRAVREAVLTVLAAQDVDAVVWGLLPNLASDDATLRNAVVEVLRTMPLAMPAHVGALLASPDSDVRVLTVMILAGLRVPEVAGWLAGVVRTDDHPNVVAAALAELLETGGDEVVELARGAAIRFPADPFLQFAAQSAPVRGAW